jgi:hypothetical protein
VQEGAVKAKRAQAEERAREALRASGEQPVLEVADVATWRPEGVGAVICDPPYLHDDVFGLHRELARFAADVLPPGGACVVMSSQQILPEVFAAFAYVPFLAWRWATAITYGTSANTPVGSRRVFDSFKVVLHWYRTDELGILPTGAPEGATRGALSRAPHRTGAPAHGPTRHLA